MNIKTKFNIDQKVLILCSSEIKEGIIKKIEIQKNREKEKIDYWVELVEATEIPWDNYKNYSEKKIYESRKDLEKKISGMLEKLNEK